MCLCFKKKFLFIILIGGLILIFIQFFCFSFGFLINYTNSFPIGIYKIIEDCRFKKLCFFKKKDLVFFCPPDLPIFEMAKKRNYIDSAKCPANKMLKKIAAIEGDVVTISANGIYVNGKFIPKSIPRKFDFSNNEMPKIMLYNYMLSKGEILFISDHSDSSFDGRYFGILHKPLILYKVKPLITWN